MLRILLGGAILALVAAHSGRVPAQVQLPATGWGSLSGKVTLVGAVPEEVSFVPKMKDHNDKACCLQPKAKPEEKIDRTWVVDPKTKAVANVVVWIKAPKGMFFPIHEKYKKRMDDVVIDQPHCAYMPYISAYNPVYFAGQKDVATGQQLIFRNSSDVQHNVLAIGKSNFNDGFNKNMGPKSEFMKTLNPQPTPILLSCGSHTWMSAKLFVFDHPYYAITKEDGTFEIPHIPAGADVSIMAWHEAVGWVLTNQGKKMTPKEGKNTLDLELKLKP
jgi:hypothetical protein